MANQNDVIGTYQPNGQPQATQRLWTDIGGGSVAENVYVAGGTLSFSASIGGWTPNGSYATLAVTNSSANVALPTGSEIVVWNTGNVSAYVNLGGVAVAATTSQIPVQPGSWISLAPGSSGYIAAITASGTTNLTIGAGSGLVTGGGTTSLTGPLPAGSNVIGGITVADGSDVTQGAKADAAYAGSGASTVVGVLKGLYAALVAPLPAGSNTVGAISNTSFGISGTLPAFAATPTVQPAIAAPATLTLATAANFTAYGTVRVQVDSLSGGDAITFAGSVASGGITYPLQQILNTQTGTIASSITANGTYIVLFAGGLYVTPTKTGSASTPTITASASQ